MEPFLYKQNRITLCFAWGQTPPPPPPPKTCFSILSPLSLCLLNQKPFKKQEKKQHSTAIHNSCRLVRGRRGQDPIVRLDVHGTKEYLTEDSHTRVIMQRYNSRFRQAEYPNLHKYLFYYEDMPFKNSSVYH